MLQSVEDTTRQAEAQLQKLRVELPRRSDMPALKIPQLRMTAVQSEFSLSDITDLGAFCRLGESLAADPAGNLRRVTLSARIVEGPDGLRRTELVSARAADRVESPLSLLPFEDLRTQLVAAVLSAPVVPARANQRYPAEQIVASFLKGLGTQAPAILSGYFDRAAGALLTAVTEEQRKLASRPRYDEVVNLTPFDKVRIGRPETSQDRFGVFKKGVGYEGYRKSLYAQDWFDSSTERDVANILEDEEEITLWVRLQIGDLPILWTGAGKEYNPDFIAVDRAGIHWIIEAKMDKEMETAAVQGKRDAARRWANHVSADASFRAIWHYLLVSEGVWEVHAACEVT